MVGHPVARGLDLFLGLRLVGGGARVDSQDIYNWANFVAATAGVRLSFDGVLGAIAR